MLYICPMKNGTIFFNRKSRFEYEFLDTYIAGIELVGTELKPIRNGKISMVDSYCFFINDELYVKNLQINNDGISFAHKVDRDRKLLLNKSELKKLKKDLIDGLSIIPYKIFINEKGFVKVEIVLAKGKKLYDKKRDKKEKDIMKFSLNKKY